MAPTEVRVAGLNGGGTAAAVPPYCTHTNQYITLSTVQPIWWLMQWTTGHVENMGYGQMVGSMDWIEQCFTSPPTQYRLYGRRFLQVKRPNQQYQSTEGTNSTQTNQTYNKQTWTQNTASPLVYNNMGWLGDDSHGGLGHYAWTAVGLPQRYP